VRSAVNLIRGIGNGETGSSKRLTKFKHAQSKNYEETRALHPNICAGSGTLHTFVRLRPSASCASSPHHGSRHPRSSHQELLPSKVSFEYQKIPLEILQEIGMETDHRLWLRSCLLRYIARRALPTCLMARCGFFDFRNRLARLR
jgi:hypothetical protein